MFRAIKAEEETFVLAVSDSDRRSAASFKFFYYDPAKDGFKGLQD